MITAMILLLVLFVPIPNGVYKDGGTRVYRSLTYKLVIWNRLVEDGVYHKVSVYWFPQSLRTLDELWELEGYEASSSGKSSTGRLYTWEKEGFGGDFNILLSDDGTYEYYTGYLSSYIGLGTWTEENGVITLREKSGYDSVFRFLLQEDALVYLEEGSDSFMGVTVEDGDRFFLSDTETADLPVPVYAERVPVLVIEANSRQFLAELEDNSSAEALVEKLTFNMIQVEMQDYGSFEKVGTLPWDLPVNDEKITTVPGDVILYQGDKITVYYDENTWSFTKLAHISGVTKNELLEAFGEGDVTVRLYLEWR